jgi:hypothetical protein
MRKQGFAKITLHHLRMHPKDKTPLSIGTFKQK